MIATQASSHHPVPLLGEDAWEIVARASARAISAGDGGGWYRSETEHQILLADARETCAALEPLLAALLAEQIRLARVDERLACAAACERLGAPDVASIIRDSAA